MMVQVRERTCPLYKGDESISLDEINYLTLQDVIASRVNETNTATINVLPGERSFAMVLRLLPHSSNRVSPVIDTQRMSAFLT